MNMRLNFRYEDLLKLGEEFKAAFEGRMRWGDTLFLTLGGDESKYLVVWTPKESSESEHLPGFYTEDGKFFMKIKPKPGAWITYADLGNIRQGIAAGQQREQAGETTQRESEDTEEPTDESTQKADEASPSLEDRKSVEQEILLGVRELERNTKNIVDFADGVVTNFTVMHRGKPISLTDLLRRDNELNIELRLLRGFKSGAYLLITDPVDAIIPEKTISAGVHLNADALIERLSQLSEDSERSVIVLYSSYLKRYPDFQDFQHYLHLQEQLAEAQQTANVFIGAAMHDPMNRNIVIPRAFTFTADNQQLEQLIHDSEAPLSACFEQVNAKIADISTNHQGRVRERVGLWNVGRSIISSILDEEPSEVEQANPQGAAVQRIISEETSSALTDFLDFSVQLFQQHFQQNTAEELINELQTYYEHINTIVGERGYIASSDLNNFIGKSTALIHDGIMIECFVQKDILTLCDIEMFEDGNAIYHIDFPITASWEINEMPEALGLTPTQKNRHAELLSQTLDIENLARRSGYGIRDVLNPLYDILLAVNGPKPPARSHSGNRDRESGKSGEFEINPEMFGQTLECIKQYEGDIRKCILHAPTEPHDYYAKLSAIISQGQMKEIVCEQVGYFEGLSLNNPDDIHELLEQLRDKQLIELENRERNQLFKNLEGELEERTGRKLSSLKKNDKLFTIHCDDVLSAINFALKECLNALDESAHDLAEIMNFDDKQLANKIKRRHSRSRKKGRNNKSAAVSLDDVYAERKRINASLERIIDSKTSIREVLLPRFHQTELNSAEDNLQLEQWPSPVDAVPELLRRLREQPDLPIMAWPVEEEPEEPTKEEVKEEPEAPTEVEVKEEPEVPAEPEEIVEAAAEEIPVATEETIEPLVAEIAAAPGEEELVIEVPSVTEEPTPAEVVEAEAPPTLVETVTPEVDVTVIEEVIPEVADTETETVTPEVDVTVIEEVIPETADTETETVTPEVDVTIVEELPPAPVEEVIPEVTDTVVPEADVAPPKIEVEVEEIPSAPEIVETPEIVEEEIEFEDTTAKVAQEEPVPVVEEEPIPEDVEAAVPEVAVAEPEELPLTEEIAETVIPEATEAVVTEEAIEIEEEVGVEETVEPAITAPTEPTVEEIITPEVEPAPTSVEAEEPVETPEEPIAEIEVIPSAEELHQEFSLLSREEILEALGANLPVAELRDYLGVREEAVLQEVSPPQEISPSDPEAWLKRVDIEQYSNTREFLQTNQLRLTTTGRQLSNLKRVSEEAAQEGMLLLAEIVELRKNYYSQTVTVPLISYLTDELERWKSIEEAEDVLDARQLLQIVRQRVISMHVCDEQDIPEFLDIAIEYEGFVGDESPLTPEQRAVYEDIEPRYLELLDTLT